MFFLGLASSEALWGVGIVSSQVFWIHTDAETEKQIETKLA